jgi:hypothetical protein
MAGGLLFVAFLLLDERSLKGSQRLLLWLLPAWIIGLSCYVLWRIPQGYKVYQVDSVIQVVAKIDIIEHYLSDVKITWQLVDGNYRSYTYRNKFFRKVDLRLYIDSSKVLFNAQGTDTTATKGCIDFGLGARAAKRFRKYLKANL